MTISPRLTKRQIDVEYHPADDKKPISSRSFPIRDSTARMKIKLQAKRSAVCI
jgi:hypothetical protein